MENYKLTINIINNYKCYLMKEERSEATIAKYLRDIRAFYNYLPDNKIVTKEITIAYKTSILDNYESSSINSMLAAVNGFLKFLGLDYCKVKKLKVQRQIYREESRELTKEEYFALLSACSGNKHQRLNLIIQTICGTGIRISELKHFTVQAVKSGKVQVHCKGKSRTVFIPTQLRDKLLIYISKKGIESGSIFITRGGKPVDRSNIWTQMQKICEIAGVAASKVFPHNLRHLFARTYYQIKKDLGKLADILGHSNIETTRIYTISTGKEHEKQIECLGLII